MKKFIYLIVSLMILGTIACKKENISTLDDSQKLAQLKVEIETFAKNKACSGGDNCKVVGVGSKPCGGPSWYVIYSLSSNNENQLLTKVNEYTELQKAYNLKNQLVGDCMALQIPTVDCKNGMCAVK